MFKIIEVIFMERKFFKSTLLPGLIIASVILLTACDAGFDAMNSDKTRLTRLEPALQLNNAIWASALTGNQIRCETSIAKQMVRIYTGVGACGNFNVDARETSSTNWNSGYQTIIRNLVDAEENVDPSSNLYQMIRIWKARTFMVLTDSYGDVPYREAALGYREGIAFPDYDSQEFIYTSDIGILAELADAAASLDASQPAESRVFLYGGNVTQWKKLGYSILLTAAMRLTKVKPEIAKKYVEIAVAGGLMESNADNVIIRHTPEFNNSMGSALNGGQSHYVYLVEDFVNFLKDNDDPRLASIAVRYPSATSPGEQNEANADRDPANQIGMPMGYDNSDIDPVAHAAGLPSFFAYSQVDRKRMMDPLAPSYLNTYALQQLLLAEAAVRGWVAGDPADYYKSGIEAHMQQLADYGDDTAIAQSDIDAYIQANPLVAGSELEQINTQYWVASFLIPTETWANFRRSGYPDLVPNPRQDDLLGDETFIRRFGYPDAEVTVNPNVKNGTQPDKIDTRVWWDVKP